MQGKQSRLIALQIHMFILKKPLILRNQDSGEHKAEAVTTTVSIQRRAHSSNQACYPYEFLGFQPVIEDEISSVTQLADWLHTYITIGYQLLQHLRLNTWEPQG